MNQIECIIHLSQECGRRKTELEAVVKGLKSEVSEGEVMLKKTSRSVEVLCLQVESLREREGELVREGREVGDTLDTAHLERLQGRVKTFERGECVSVSV